MLFEVGRHVLRIARATHIGIDIALRRLELRRINGLRQACLGAVHQRGMESATNRQLAR